MQGDTGDIDRVRERIFDFFYFCFFRIIPHCTTLVLSEEEEALGFGFAFAVLSFPLSLSLSLSAMALASQWS